MVEWERREYFSSDEEFVKLQEMKSRSFADGKRQGEAERVQNHLAWVPENSASSGIATEADANAAGKDNYEPPQEDLTCLLDPISYYTSLDHLELKVAEICGFGQPYDFQHSNTGSAEQTKATTRQSLDGIRQASEAFELLSREGFCGSQFNISVQDTERWDIERSLITRTVPIDSSILSEIRSIGEHMGDRPTHYSEDSVRKHISNKVKDIQALDSQLTKLGFSGKGSKCRLTDV